MAVTSFNARQASGAEACAVAAIAFAVYCWGACPTIYVGDSGELVTAVHVLGIPHPTGYPLYVLLGKAWTLIFPFGSIAYRMSVFSAVCAAAAVGLMYWLCRRHELSRFAAAFGALLLAFSLSFWSQANIQRVYALGAVFVLLATAAALKWYRDPTSRRLALAFFLCGLGATNHSFMLVYAAALTCFALLTHPHLVLRARTLLTATAAMGIGLLPYLYLPLRSRADPPLDWGNPETLQAFLDVVIRRDFWQRAWVERPADLFPVVDDFLRSLGSELTWAGVSLALMGVAAGGRRRFPVTLPLLIIAGNVAALTLHGSHTDIFVWHRYYIPAYAMTALLAAIGCDAVVRFLPGALRPLPLLIPVFVLTSHWRDVDRSRYRIAEALSQAILDSVPPGSHLIAEDDNILFVLMYLTMVEGQRPDVDLILQGVGEVDLPPLRFDPDVESVFFTHHPNWHDQPLEAVPVGLVFQAVRTGQRRPEPIVPIRSLPGADDPSVPKDYLTQNVIAHFHYMLGVTSEERDWLSARASLTAAAAVAPSNDVLFYNLGLIYSRNGLIEDAIAAFEQSQRINPRHLATRKRPRAADRLAELVSERDRLAQIRRSLSAQDDQLRHLRERTPEYHRRLAVLLAERGETRAARGHRLRADEIDGRN